ncbi:MAG: HD domain-containing protein [Anaerolineae bacterium]
MLLTPEQVRPLYTGDDAAHDFDHVLRVLANAIRIGHVEQANMDILTTATLLHDIARPNQRRTGKDHAVEGARRAEILLREMNQPPAVIEAVCHAIASHRFRNNNPPQTLEAKILYDADKLDSIGAVGVARVFAYGGHLNRPLWAEDDAGHHTSLQEFRVKLFKIKDRLFTATAREIAVQRHTFMVNFFQQMSAEIAGIK